MTSSMTLSTACSYPIIAAEKKRNQSSYDNYSAPMHMLFNTRGIDHVSGSRENQTAGEKRKREYEPKEEPDKAKRVRAEEASSEMLLDHKGGKNDIARKGRERKQMRPRRSPPPTYIKDSNELSKSILQKTTGEEQEGSLSSEEIADKKIERLEQVRISEDRAPDKLELGREKRKGEEYLGPYEVKRPRSHDHVPSKVQVEHIYTPTAPFQELNRKATMMGPPNPESLPETSRIHRSALEEPEKTGFQSANRVDPLTVPGNKPRSPRHRKLLKTRAFTKPTKASPIMDMEHRREQGLVSTSPVETNEGQLDKIGSDLSAPSAAAANDLSTFSSTARNEKTDDDECSHFMVRISKRSEEIDQDQSAPNQVAANGLLNASETAGNEKISDDNSSQFTTPPSTEPKVFDRDQSAPSEAAANDLPNPSEPASEEKSVDDNSVQSTTPLSTQPKETDRDQSARCMAAANGLSNPSGTTSNEMILDDNDGQFANPLATTPHATNQEHPSKKIENSRSAISLAANEVSECLKIENDAENVNSNGAAPTLEAATNPTKSLFGGLEDKFFIAAKNTFKVEDDRKELPAEAKEASLDILLSSISEEDVARWLSEKNRHRAVDLDDPVAIAKHKTRQPTICVSNDEKKKSEGKERQRKKNKTKKRVAETCQTWQETMMHAMDKFSELGSSSREGMKLPRDSGAADKQRGIVIQFKETAELMIKKFCRALDDARYTTDGVLRDDIETGQKEDRAQGFDRFDYEPPLKFGVPIASSYFEEVDEADKPMPNHQNTPISNVLLNSEEGEVGHPSAGNSLPNSENVDAVEDAEDQDEEEEEEYAEEDEDDEYECDRFTRKRGDREFWDVWSKSEMGPGYECSHRDGTRGFDRAINSYEENKNVMHTWNEGERRSKQEYYAKEAAIFLGDALEQALQELKEVEEHRGSWSGEHDPDQGWVDHDAKVCDTLIVARNILVRAKGAATLLKCSTLAGESYDANEEDMNWTSDSRWLGSRFS